MKSLKIKNTKYNFNESSVITLIILFFAFLIAGVFTLCFIAYFSQLLSMVENTIAILIFLFFITIATASCIQICKLKKQDVYLQDNIKNKLIHVEFTESCLNVSYTNNIKNISIPYNDIIECNLLLKIQKGYTIGNNYNLAPVNLITSFSLNITDCENHKITIINNEIFGLIDKIFDIIHFSQYIQNFNYEFSYKDKSLEPFEKAIKSYINNKYRHTLYSIGFTKYKIPIIIITTIISFLILFGIGYCVTQINWLS